MAIVKATEAQAFIVEFSNQHATQANIRQCGTAFYTDTINFFSDSLGDIDRNNFVGANDDAERASNGVLDCENILKHDKKDYPEIHSLNKGVYLMSDIAYLATKHVIHK
jgi:hypothetical protein